ncbi:MAG: ERAP1-like C-terminal domain-containing protein [Deltaproteobacteria bacterium]|nr:ERAP1-like C-terminal domain-containing protein [Deltaproteobacteria bacterium]
MGASEFWKPAYRPASVVLVALLGVALLLSACAGGGPGEALSPAASVDGWQRLDRSVVPRRYELDLTVDPRKTRFHGTVGIDVELSRPTRVIRLHAEALSFAAVRITQGGQVQAARAVPGRNGGMALVVERELAAGPARLEIDYAGAFPEHGHGLYRVEEEGRWYAFTQFQPISARRAFPGFDQPEFKTPFHVKLRVPREMTAASSGPMVSRVTRGPERIFLFDETKPIPTYLLALAVGEFDELPVPGDGRGRPPLRMLTPAGRGPLASYAAERTPAILDWLVDWFGRPLPFAKLDQLAVPEFTFGAMENVGLVTYREARLLLDPVHATQRDHLWTNVTIAHEISHMWFGNLVTLPWWDDVWLNESFASWMQTKVIDSLYPELEAGLQVAAHTQWVYGKGGAVLRMVEAWVGEAAFQEAVRGYLDDHAYGSGGTPELLAALDRSSGKDVTGVVGGFIDRPGTPLVSAELVCDGEGAGTATLELSQRRYLPAGRRDDSKPWSFPLCVRWDAGAGEEGAPEAESTCFQVEAASHAFRLPAEGCPSWVHPNVDELGYYRWSLPEAELLALTRTHLDRLTLRERLALPGNLRALLEAGEIEVEAYLDGLLALSADPHRRMAEAIVPGLNGLSRVVDEAEHEPFAKYVRRVLGPYLDRIGVEPRAGEPNDATLLRSRLVRAIAGEGRDPMLRARARAAVAALLAGDTTAYTAEELRVFLPMGSWDADAAHWGQLLAALQSTKSPTLRRNLLAALGSFDDPELVKRSLRLVLDGTLRASDWSTVAGSIRRPAHPGAWAFIESHHAALVERLGPVAAAGLPRMAGSFCSRREHDAVEAFFKRQPPVPGRKRNLDLTLEDIERCAEARETVGGPLQVWLAALPD